MAKLTVKFLQQKLDVSEPTAKRYLKDLKQTYTKAKVLTDIHYKDYFENLETS